MLRRLLTGLAVTVVLAGCASASRPGVVTSINAATTTTVSPATTAGRGAMPCAPSPTPPSLASALLPTTSPSPSSSSLPTSRPRPATASMAPGTSAHSVADCRPLSPGGGLGQPLRQSLDGTISGCFRVGRFQPGQSTLTLVADPQPVITGPPGGSASRLTLTPDHGPPGTNVTIGGDIPGAPPAATANRQDDHITVCWAGCARGLTESANVHWSAGAPGQFETALTVPATAWLGADGPHPLQPGPYAVEIACIPPQFSLPKPATCGGVHLSATFHLEAPAAKRCTPGQPCAWLRFSPTQGPVGSLVRVTGWAPLTALIGRPFGYYLVLQQDAEPSPHNPYWRPIILAPTPFTILASTAWSTLGPIRPRWVQRSGAASIVADPTDPRRLAYCAPGGIRLTTDGGAIWATVSTTTARLASVATTYPIVPPFFPTAASPLPPGCQSVTLGAGQPGVLYAVFTATRKGTAPPPLYSVGYRTGDAGQSWQPIPAPAGQEMGDFAGFQVDGAAVLAFFTRGQHGAGGAVERTLDGGKTWLPATPTCPTAGPCVRFGAEQVGNCAKFGSPQAIRFSLDGGRHWAAPAWPDRVNACGLHELAGLAIRGALLLGGDLSPLLLSNDGGRTWQNVALPPLQAPPGAAAGFPGLQLLPNGSLLASGAFWQLLLPGASSWCRVPTGVLPPVNGDPQVIGDRLWWLQGGPGPHDPEQPLSARSIPLGRLHCARQ